MGPKGRGNTPNRGEATASIQPAATSNANVSPIPTQQVNANPLPSTTGSDISAIQKSVEKIQFVNDIKAGVYKLVQDLTTAKSTNPLITVAHVKPRIHDKVWSYLTNSLSTSIDLTDENNIDWDNFLDNLQQLSDSYKLNNASIDDKINKFDIKDFIDPQNHETSSGLLYQFTDLCSRSIGTGSSHTEESICNSFYESMRQTLVTNKDHPVISNFIKVLFQIAKKGTVPENKAAFEKLCANKDNPSTPDATTLSDFNYRFGRAVSYQQKIINVAQSMGMTFPNKKDNSSKDDTKRKAKDQLVPDAKRAKTGHGPCSACGNQNHDRDHCKLLEIKHPNCNLDKSKAFHDSDQGKKYLSALQAFDKNLKDARISARHIFKDNKVTVSDDFKIPSKGNNNHLNIINSINFCNCITCESLNTINNNNNNQSKYYPQITNNPNFIDIIIRQGTQVIKTKALLDTGAYSNSINYINLEISKFLIDAGNKGEKSNRVVCGPLSNSECNTINLNFNFNVNIITEFNINLNFEVIASAIDTPYPIIFSREFIKQYSLTLQFPSHFLAVHDIQKLETFFEGVHGVDSINALRVDQRTYREGDIIQMEDLLDISPEDDGGLKESLTENLPWEIADKDRKINDEEFVPTRLYGSESFKEKIRIKCRKWIHVFKREITTTPAKLKPMEINVDKEKWDNLQKNRRYRVQSRPKQIEIERQVSQMLRLKIISPTEAAILSQVLLTPKPNDMWRFCIDFRELNEISQASGWPLPNIRHTLRRLGEHKAKIFGVMDLTSGFHQAPLADISKVYTAFTTWVGNFQFERVPFGLKGAPSYYQQQIQSEVLRGIIYRICEVYIDDVITIGKTEDEFLANLDTILERFSLYGITVNPDKCKLGMPEVEYVGHTINSLGLSFTDEKLESVASFPLPEYPKILHQFLGLMNYFRDHVRNHSDLAQPLNAMLSKAPEKQKLNWTEELKKSFETLKYCVHNCRMLFFVDGDYPVHLCTDASAYGIGAYLYQIIDGVEKPIQFLSKSLTDTQRRWSVAEKEAFAIYYALQKLEYLLRDVKFTLHTDHINLTYINEKANTSDKVYNWKLFIQHFNFDIQYIQGSRNVVADSCSRLCAIIDREDMTDKQYINIIYEFRIPENIKTKFTEVHNSVVGHQGVRKTRKRLVAAGIPSTNLLTTYVQRLIRLCVTCQKQRFDRLLLNTRPYTTGTYEPMACLNWDTIGPMPEDKYGFKYLINIIDQFSRYNNLIPSKEVDADSACRALIKHSGVFGRPYQILNDGGSQYVNEAVEQLVQILKINQITTTAYSKEQAAIVERSNKEVNRYLISIVNDEKCVDAWSDYVPLVSRIMNSTVHESIGIAPCQIITPKVDLDRGMIFNHDEPMEDINLADWMNTMLTKQNELIHIAQQFQKERDDAHVNKTMQNRPPSQIPYQVGGYVLLEHPTTNNRRQGPTKLSLLRTGPYKIVSIDNRNYTLLDLVTNKEKKVDIDRLTPFEYDPEVTNPIIVAAQDKDVFIIESILQHKGPRSNPKFLIKWLGYDNPNDNTWEPVNMISTNEVFHKYCREHDMLTLIPSRFRESHEINRRK